MGGQAVHYEVSLQLDCERLGGQAQLAKLSPMQVGGRIDAATPDAIWELKCTGGIDAQHLLQLALYGWLWNTLPAGTGQPCAATHGPRRLLLLNFRTGEVREVTSSPEELAQVARVLMEACLRGDPNITDAEFLHNCEQLRAPFVRAI